MVALAEAVGKKAKKFKVGDVEVNFRPKVKEVAVLMSLATKQQTGNITEEDFAAMLNAVVEMIYRANKDEDISKEDIEYFVIDNLADVLEGILKALGVADEEKFRERK